MAYYTTQSVIYGRAWVNTVLAALAVDPAAALIVTGKIRLSKDPAFNPTAASTKTELAAQEADYTGYAVGGVAFVPGAPVNLTANQQGVVDPVTFRAAADDPQIDNSVYGWWLDDGTNVVCAEKFADNASFSMAVLGDFLQLDVVLPFSLLQNAG